MNRAKCARSVEAGWPITEIDMHVGSVVIPNSRIKIANNKKTEDRK